MSDEIPCKTWCSLGGLVLIDIIGAVSCLRATLKPHLMDVYTCGNFWTTYHLVAYIQSSLFVKHKLRTCDNCLHGECFQNGSSGRLASVKCKSTELVFQLT